MTDYATITVSTSQGDTVNVHVTPKITYECEIVLYTSEYATMVDLIDGHNGQDEQDVGLCGAERMWYLIDTTDTIYFSVDNYEKISSVVNNIMELLGDED